MLRKAMQITFFSQQACRHVTGSPTHIELQKKLTAQLESYRELNKMIILEDDYVLDLVNEIKETVAPSDEFWESSDNILKDLEEMEMIRKIMKEDLIKEMLNTLDDIKKECEVVMIAASDEKSLKMS